MLSLVDEADGDSGLFDGSVEGTPTEIGPAPHALDVGRDFAAVDP